MQQKTDEVELSSPTTANHLQGGTVIPHGRDGLGTVLALEGNGEGVDDGGEVLVLSKGQGKGVLQVLNPLLNNRFSVSKRSQVTRRIMLLCDRQYHL